MASNLRQTSGSIFSGNPITVSCRAMNISEEVFFHRVIFIVTVAGSTFNFPAQVQEEGGEVEMDISSALRAIFDNYQWSAETLVSPSATWKVTAHDEYFLNGELKVTDKVSLSGTECYPGGFSDYERIMNNVAIPMRFSRKPTNAPEVVEVGDSVCVPVTGNRPQSAIYTLSEEGLYSDINVYAKKIEKNERRMSIRFINKYGCLESISIPGAGKKKANYNVNQFVVALRERFDKPSHKYVKKEEDPEMWEFSSGPLTYEWQQWFLHEFLTAEHAWANINGKWIRINVFPEEEIEYFNKTKRDMYEVQFSIQFDINGHIGTLNK